MRTKFMRPIVLVILAHPDDEVAIAPLLEAEVARGETVVVLFATDGATRSVPASRRCSESSVALRSIGISKDHITFLGVEIGVADGSLMTQLPRAYAALNQQFTGTPIRRLYTLAWEGGHTDHDAVHLLALAFAKSNGVAQVAQFPIYNGLQTAPLFRVMQPLPEWAIQNITHFSLSDGIRYSALPLHYPSQRKTWLGLMSGVLREYLVKRRNAAFTVDFAAVLDKPHGGTLLYERLFRIPYDVFRVNTAPFIAEHF